MLPIEDADWLEDFRIKLSKREVADYVTAVGETLVFTKSRLAVAAWLVVPGVAGGALGGMLTGAAIWASWMSVLAYFVALPAVWWSMRRLTGQLLGPALQWQAVVLLFFTFLIGGSAVFGGRFDSAWWAYRRRSRSSAFGPILVSARGAHPVRGKGRAHPQLLDQHEPSFSLIVRTPGAL